MELVALSVAAGCQAVALVSTASRQLLWQAAQQHTSDIATLGAHKQQQQQVVAMQQPQHTWQAAGMQGCSGGVLQLATNAALVLALLCGAGLRYLQPRCVRVCAFNGQRAL